MWFLGGLAENIIAGIASAPILAFLSFLVYRILREMFRGKFYKALFSALGTKDPKDMERYRLKHYVKHSFVLESAETDDEALSYRQFIKKVKTTKYVILTGSAGIGKSKLMQRLALQFRSHYHKGTTGEGIKNYGILFYKLNGDESVEHIVSRIKADLVNSQINYTLFLDGLDEMSGIQADSGDKVLKELIRTLNKEVSGSCKTVFISLRPEILGKGFSFSQDIRDAEIAIFKLRNFNEQQILAMYRNESRISESERETWIKIPAKTRRENIKKLKTVVKNNPESVFTYPLILTWANEILSGHSVESLQYISWYVALGEVIRQELERECVLYCSTNNFDSPNKQFAARFLKDGTDFLKEIAVKMALSNKKQLTESEVLEGTVAQRLLSEYGKTSIIARHLLRYIDWSEKDGSIFYEFLHNAIYWRALAEVLLDPITPQDVRAQIILKEAENKFSTPLLQYCRQGLWAAYEGKAFPYRDELAYRRDIEKKTIYCNTKGNDIPLEVVLSCCYGFDEVVIDYSLRLDSVKIQEFVNDRKLDLSYSNVERLTFLKNFGINSFDVLDCFLSHVVEAVIPNYVKEVNFKRCASLRSVSFPDDSCLSKIGEEVFAQCKFLTSIEIPGGVTRIGEFAFQGCTSLTSIEIPEKVTSIEKAVFLECTSLINIKIPDGVTSIGEGAFWQCTSLTSIKIPDGVTSIGKVTFAQCMSLTEIKLPNNLTVIGEFSFYECTSLTSIDIPEKVTSIEKAAFWQCTSLTDIKLPDGLTKIGESALMGCTSLTCIEIPDSVTSVRKFAFAKCTSLTSIEIPEKVTSIEESVFWQCTSLTDIELPKNLTVIGKFAFQECTSLTSIEIPDSVMKMGSMIFMGCFSLAQVTYGGTIAEWNQIEKIDSFGGSNVSEIICTDGSMKIG